MKTKLALLAAVILAGIGSTAVIAGRDATTPTTPVADKPAGMSCCAMGQKLPAKPADKDVPATNDMSCHTGTPAAPVARKGCCK